MKIVGEVVAQGQEYKLLKIGDVYVFEERVLMKIAVVKVDAVWNMNAVALDDGKLFYVPPYVVVQPREAEVVLK